MNFDGGGVDFCRSDSDNEIGRETIRSGAHFHRFTAMMVMKKMSKIKKKDRKGDAAYRMSRSGSNKSQANDCIRPAKRT